MNALKKIKLPKMGEEEKSRLTQQYHAQANEKMKELTLAYFGEAKDNIREKEKIFDSYNWKWKKFADKLNRSQNLVQVKLEAFKERTDFIVAHAERMNEQNKTKIVGLDGKPLNS